MVRWIFAGVAGVVAVSLLLALVPGAALAATLPDVTISTDYPTVNVQAGKSAKFTIRFTNNGTVDRQLDISISGPEDWKPQLKSQSFIVRSAYIAAGKSLVADFQVEPPPTTAPGDYRFVIRGVSPDGAGEAVLNLTIGIQDTGPSGVRLVTQYPVLRGGADKAFEFKVDLVNQSDEDRDFTLAARAPEGWEVTFQPAYEKRQISELRVKAGETRGLDIQVTPPRTARAGDYPILIVASAGPDQATAELKAQITGNYKLTLGTPTGTLNAQATAGEESKVTLNVQNTGSGDLMNVSLSAQKPEGWEVWFQPEALDRIPAGGSREVVMSVKPSNRAIPGDYMVRVTASNPQVSEQVGIRVSVGTPTQWGLVGLGIIALSLGGLYGVFRRFSRR
ncbi:MAG TPA: NEW3 domain-containing protein [Chloroflexota bacterium]|nr:NEW3 domain-containing protein [Chloroflexota bacterium]HZU05065.1 NEW3 domain-containing protein [Chloroflexota bacterium]